MSVGHRVDCGSNGIICDQNPPKKPLRALVIDNRDGIRTWLISCWTAADEKILPWMAMGWNGWWRELAKAVEVRLWSIGSPEIEHHTNTGSKQKHIHYLTIRMLILSTGRGRSCASLGAEVLSTTGNSRRWGSTDRCREGLPHTGARFTLFTDLWITKNRDWTLRAPFKKMHSFALITSLVFLLGNWTIRPVAHQSEMVTSGNRVSFDIRIKIDWKVLNGKRAFLSSNTCLFNFFWSTGISGSWRFGNHKLRRIHSRSFACAPILSVLLPCHRLGWAQIALRWLNGARETDLGPQVSMLKRSLNHGIALHPLENVSCYVAWSERAEQHLVKVIYKFPSG